MSQPEVYQEVQSYLAQHLRDAAGHLTLSRRSLDRLTLLTVGILKAQHAAPARIAQAGQQLSSRGSSAESVERRVRRIENDPHLEPATCLAPLVKTILSQSPIRRLVLILDVTLQQDRVVLLSLQVGYRGRCLPLAWSVWPANRPLTGERFWQRVGALLDQAALLLPAGVEVWVVADRAFGTPAFTDLVARHTWHWVVRVQGQTRCRDRMGREHRLSHLVSQPGERRKLQGQVFKKAGWRSASVVVYWGKGYPDPLCLVSDLPPDWELIARYRQRFPAEPSFRDLKSAGWHWEQGQVTQLDHLAHLLLGMALATWLTLLVGARLASHLLAQPVTSHRRTRPWWGKFSIFQVGLQGWAGCFAEGMPPWLDTYLPDWDAPNWSTQITAHHARAFLFA